MALSEEYAERLRCATEVALRLPVPLGEGDQTAAVHRTSQDGEQRLRLTAQGRTLNVAVDDAAYHYEPDGEDVEQHASLLAQLFNEDARRSPTT